jgi:hypothetical protein
MKIYGHIILTYFSRIGKYFERKVVGTFDAKPISSVRLPGFEMFKLERGSSAVSSINSKTVD